MAKRKFSETSLLCCHGFCCIVSIEVYELSHTSRIIQLRPGLNDVEQLKVNVVSRKQ